MSLINSFAEFQKPQPPALTEKLTKISKQEAVDGKMVGPLFHGTTADRLSAIEAEGFKIFKTYKDYLSRNILNGYNMDNYANSMPPPLHHLGFGIYFTNTKSIGKKYNGDSVKNLHEYYADIKPDRLATINFASQKAMMKWWLDNGYPADMAKQALAKYDVELWMKATEILTENLSAQYDAVFFKGKTLRSVLDGDQICVYRPELIHRIDPKLASGLGIGAKVIRLSDGMKGVVLNIREMTQYTYDYSQTHNTHEWENMRGCDMKYYEIKWAKGGRDYNVFSTQFKLA